MSTECQNANAYLLGSGFIGSAGLWQGLEGPFTGVSEGLEDKSEQDLLDGFSSDLSHDGALSSQILITEAQEVVDHKCCRVTE